MIKNQYQFGVSQAQARRFEESIAAARAKEVPADIHPRLWQANLDGMESQLTSLRREIAEYEELNSGVVNKIEVNNLKELPIGLIKARIARGLTHKDLAVRLGVKPQQIQRWENEDYGTASFSRLVEIADALEVEVSEIVSFRGSGAKSKVDPLTAAGDGSAKIEKGGECQKSRPGDKRELTLINLIAVRVRDHKMLADFYRVLGLDFRLEKHGAGPEHYSCTAGGTVFEIYPLYDGDSATNGTRLGFTTKRLKEVVRDLVSRNASVISAPRNSPWGLRAVLQDPEGHKIELVQNSAS